MTLSNLIGETNSSPPLRPFHILVLFCLAIAGAIAFS